MKPVLNQVLEKFLQITAEMDSEKLVSSLEEIMNVYGEDIVPFANQICTQLVAQFMRQIANEDEPEAFCAAVGTVSAIRKVLESSQKQPLILQALHSTIAPALLKGLQSEGLDVVEEIVDCATILAYHTRGSISQSLWSLFVPLIELVIGSQNRP